LVYGAGSRVGAPRLTSGRGVVSAMEPKTWEEPAFGFPVPPVEEPGAAVAAPLPAARTPNARVAALSAAVARRGRGLSERGKAGIGVPSRSLASCAQVNISHHSSCSGVSATPVSLKVLRCPWLPAPCCSPKDQRSPGALTLCTRAAPSRLPGSSGFPTAPAPHVFPTAPTPRLPPAFPASPQGVLQSLMPEIG